MSEGGRWLETGGADLIFYFFAGMVCARCSHHFGGAYCSLSALLPLALHYWAAIIPPGERGCEVQVVFPSLLWLGCLSGFRERLCWDSILIERLFIPSLTWLVNASYILLHVYTAKLEYVTYNDDENIAFTAKPCMHT